MKIATEPKWIIGCLGLGGKRLAPFAKVTRAQWRRAIREAQREALLSIAGTCRSTARDYRQVSGMPMEALQWEEFAEWLEKRAEAKASA